MPTLIISEKPNAATKIAESIGKHKKHVSGKTYYFEAEAGGRKYYIVPSVGHIFSLKQASKGSTYPKFDVEWKPSFEVGKGSAFSKPYYDNFVKVTKKCDDFIIATDFDVEGSVIGFNILKYICGKSDAKRMKFSTLTKEDLVEAFENRGPLDTEQIEAGLARHELDWYFGINLSRALTHSISESGKGFQIMSIGRVQGPALKILADRELKIKAFVPEPFWQVEANVNGIKAMYEYDKIPTKDDAMAVRNSCGKVAVVSSVKKKTQSLRPPFPFDLTTLQTEAYSAFGFSPSNTLSLAQSLYDQGAISYPRTSSQKLPEKIGYDKILRKLSLSRDYGKLINDLPKPLVPNEGPKSDSAHPSIYPTGHPPKSLTVYQRKLYDMIIRRFISVFSKSAVRESVHLEFDVDGNKFLAAGHKTLESNWMGIYNFSKAEESELPKMEKGDESKVKSVKVLEKETHPPKRFTEASIVRELEKRNIGTKATRSEIVRTLFERNYLKGKSIEVTEFGLDVVKILSKYTPEILSEKLTREFEEEMDDIIKGKSKREKILQKARSHITQLLENFQKHEKKIGEELGEKLRAVREEERTVGKCPKCGRDLKMITSKASRKRFIGCAGYEEGCQTSFPLPQFGMVKKTDKKCKVCEHPIVLVIRKGARPWNLCINMDCPTKDEWKKKQEEKLKAKEAKSKKPVKKTAKKTTKKPVKKTTKKAYKKK